MARMSNPTSMRPLTLPLGRAHTSPVLTTPTTPRARKAGEKGEKGRQSFSCAECRRLKLRCSRVWPCTSCEKRGCAQICPKGEMKTGKGKRLILADTEELHQRISQLEVALAQAHSMNHTSPHPLLDSPYLFHSREATTTKPKLNEAGLMVMQDEDEILEGALGTLTISGEGEARFVGSFAGSEYLREGDETAEGPVESGLVTPPASATAGSFDFRTTPFNPLGIASRADIDYLRTMLPDWESEGKQLVETYWEHVNWMYQILPRAMFDTDHLPNAYDKDAPANAHKIACVFLVMAIGVMFDLNRKPFDVRGEQLFSLGRACLGAIGLEHASPATVQALHLCGTYMLNDKEGNGAEMFWPLLGTAVKIAQSLGLHRDGETFGLSPYEVEERRQVWWEIVTYDRLQALCFGRPCASTNRTSDTKFPDPAAGYSADGDGYHQTKYRLITLMEKIIDIQTQTTAVSVQQVKQLDKEFREFEEQIPAALMPNVPILKLPLDSSIHPHLIIHRLGIRLLVAQSRLLLNRPSFARALGENPDDPSWGKFGGSFVGVYESAQEIVQLVRQLVIYHPALIARWWFFWFHAFTASVCLAAIAIRAPISAFASPAFHGMTIVCDISAAARPGCRAKKGLPILLRLQKRAAEALVAAGKSPSMARAIPVDNDDDLSHLHTSAKLRRVGSSPSSKKASPTSLEATPAPQESHLPPTSPLSIATSATLAEAEHYDAGDVLSPMTGVVRGAVPPPPALPACTPATSAWLSLSPLEQANTAQPLQFTWPPIDISPSGAQSGSCGAPNQYYGITEIDLGLDRAPGGPIGLGMTLGQASVPLQPVYNFTDLGGTNDPAPQQGHTVHNPNIISLAIPPSGGYHGPQQGTGGVQMQDMQYEPQQGMLKMDGIDEMDWEMFVNQMAVGEVGLDGNWQ